MELHGLLFQRDPRLILNMDETMLTAKRRLKELAQKGRLPLIPEAVKVPHLSGCVTFTASGVFFDPLIFLPNKKTLRKTRTIFWAMLLCWNNSRLGNKKHFYILLHYFNYSKKYKKIGSF